MEILEEILQLFLDPRKRICILYLGSAFLIACIWMKTINGLTVFQASGIYFSRKIWFSKSAQLDYILFFTNKVLFSIISNYWITTTTTTLVIFEFLHHLYPPNSLVTINPSIVVISFTATLFIVDDFTKYWTHWLLHNVPALWVFHKVHHSADTLTPFTIFRTHPIEMFIFSARAILVHSFIIASFIYFFGKSVDLLTVMGANLFLFVFHMLGSNLRHSHIYIKYWNWLEYWLISPAQHQIHHSKNPIHHGKNLGIALAVWDRLGKTLMVAPDTQNLVFGLSDNETSQTYTLRYIYLNSFKNSFTALISPIRKWNFPNA